MKREGETGQGADERGRVTHRDLARWCGVSTASISRALSGHPSVRPDLRERILREAKKRGYQQDPRLGYLSHLRWPGGRRLEAERIVVLTDRYTGAEPGAEKFRQLQETATELGYELEFHQCETMAGKERTLSRRFHHRGIRGMLVTLHRDDVLPELEWSRFAVIMVGEECADRPFHRVNADWRAGFDLLRTKMLEKGRRIGFCQLRHAGERSGVGRGLYRTLRAEVLLQRDELAQLGHAAVPEFTFGDEDASAPGRFEEWCCRYELDTVCCNDLSPAQWIDGLKQSGCALEWAPKLFIAPWREEARRYQLSGLEIPLGERLSLGLKMLHQSLLLDSSGYETLPTKTLIPLVWRDGK